MNQLHFDPENKIIKLCAEGMMAEGKGEMKTAENLFLQAWNEAESDFEKFTAAHFVARHQESISAKLKWDETALKLASRIQDESIKSSFPSLYLNIGKCYEDLKELIPSKENYQMAASYLDFLSDDGYGKMIKSGILDGLERVKHV